MSIPLIDKTIIPDTRQSTYDLQSGTMIECVARLQSVMNEIITDYNSFRSELETTLNEWSAAESEKDNQFQVAMGQKFQDFIDIIELKVLALDNSVKSCIESVGEYSDRIQSVESEIETVNQSVDQMRTEYDEFIENYNSNIVLAHTEPVEVSQELYDTLLYIPNITNVWSSNPHTANITYYHKTSGNSIQIGLQLWCSSVGDAILNFTNKPKDYIIPKNSFVDITNIINMLFTSTHQETFVFGSAIVDNVGENGTIHALHDGLLTQSLNEKIHNPVLLS